LQHGKHVIKPFRSSTARFFTQFEKLDEFALLLQTTLDESSTFINVNHKKTGPIQLEQFKPRMAKDIIDKIDIALQESYGFTNEELDFIINYDIKYRMGDDLFADEEAW